MTKIVILFILPLIVSQLVLSHSVLSSFNKLDTSDNGFFPSTLFSKISKQSENKNIILSPFSIQAALTLLYMGANNETADEFRNTLQYKSPNKLDNADIISQILNSKLDGLVQLKLANKIYSAYELAPRFNEIAAKYFKSEAERANFADTKAIVDMINSWVEEKTNEKIKNLLSLSSIGKETTAVLVNAIYFKAKWADQFSNHTTKKQAFWISENQSVDVDTMHGKISAKYGEFPELDSTAIELKFEDNDMALLVILPNQRDGLRSLEEKIENVDLTVLSANMNEDDVIVKLPKFKIEFDIELIPILRKLGMKISFSDNADYSGIFKSNSTVKVSDVVHKAYIDVNENGSEAAAATYIKTVFLSNTYDPNPNIFAADHPFVFAIKNNDAVFFLGHVVRF